ncbi:hypothetical protein GCM10007425_26360 [Lysinibacillus alkalisoli]|uniref:Alkaline shock response membrane anchor protein AmaP n=1 Tax=Lysinibacillus alkalisoli TaxID=1911548 RepID=A0A917LJH6_9BACI|nr:alkaline shock response membrane anchor protein AmaP [Lysinibacillus alkalisoli]GGG30451.1 hypothetical protein GCM10007425_26360 [Lysinibacillus alkalisoli]
MKRFVSLIFGLLIFVVTATLLFLYAEVPSWEKYQQELTSYSWFDTALYSTAGILLVIALFMIIFAFLPSHRKRGLYLKYNDGEIYLNKRSIEKNIQHTVAKYNDIRQPTINVKLYQKKKASYIDIVVDLFVAQSHNVQTLLETLREDIKESTEDFSELPVREVKLNVLDQKLLNKRVL